jgi:hypothetical protein
LEPARRPLSRSGGAASRPRHVTLSRALHLLRRATLRRRRTLLRRRQGTGASRIEDSPQTRAPWGPEIVWDHTRRIGRGLWPNAADREALDRANAVNAAQFNGVRFGYLPTSLICGDNTGLDPNDPNCLSA